MIRWSAPHVRHSAVGQSGITRISASNLDILSETSKFSIGFLKRTLQNKTTKRNEGTFSLLRQCVTPEPPDWFDLFISVLRALFFQHEWPTIPKEIFGKMEDVP